MLVGACGSSSAANGPCADLGDDARSGALRCELAIELSRAQLGSRSLVVASIKVMRGFPCPPNVRCRAPREGEVSVLFTFWIGDPAIVFVHPLENGVGFVAEPPEPAPDYLL